jgi:hypothetical protein
MVFGRLWTECASYAFAGIGVLRSRCLNGVCSSAFAGMGAYSLMIVAIVRPELYALVFPDISLKAEIGVERGEKLLRNMVTPLGALEWTRLTSRCCCCHLLT